MPNANNTETRNILLEIIDQQELNNIIFESGLKEYSQETKTQMNLLLNEVVQFTESIDPDSQAILETLIKTIDDKISKQLNEILHDKKFQKLESSWRGLKYLVDNTETSSMLQIQVLDITKEELKEDTKKTTEFTNMYKKIVDTRFQQFGGDSFGTLIGDFEFRDDPKDYELLTKISQIAAATHTPYIGSASPHLFGCNTYEDIINKKDLSQTFDGEQYATWRSFRNSEDSKYVSLCLPYMLLRAPHNIQKSTLEFDEEVEGTTDKNYLWGNVAYALAVRITNAFEKYHWCASIRGVENGGLVENLPIHSFKTDGGNIANKCPTQVQINDNVDKKLSDLGFIPLSHCKGADFAAFFSLQTTHLPKKYDGKKGAAANASEKLSSQLPYIMIESRFAHNLKPMMRNKLGKYWTKENLQSYLNEWISDYILLNDNAGQETKARYPLKGAEITVLDDDSKPGAYKLIIKLLPHFQLDEVMISLRLVGKLGQKN